MGVVLCYLCISLLLQTKDDFRFIIPYVEFSKDVKGLKPYILDTSVVIDGRVADLVETDILDNTLIMPRFVLGELQRIADSSDKLRRSRGRRGLDILNRLRTDKKIDLKIYDRDLAELSGQPVDMKLVLLAKHLEGKIVTGDYNLNKIARLHNVPVINLNDVANALKPVYLPGETFNVRIVKPGEAPGTGCRLSGRRHDDRGRRWPGSHRRDGQYLRDQCAADQCRADDLRPFRTRRWRSRSSRKRREQATLTVQSNAHGCRSRPSGWHLHAIAAAGCGPSRSTRRRSRYRRSPALVAGRRRRWCRCPGRIEHDARRAGSRPARRSPPAVSGKTAKWASRNFDSGIDQTVRLLRPLG